MNDFKESYKVQEDELNKNNEIIRKLNELEQIYNPEGENLSKRTKVLRSGENVFFNVMLISGILFSLNDTSKGIVDSTVVGRIKSLESTEKKEKRKGRENKTNGDIIACNIITDRVHNSEDFFNVFRSSKIQGLYNERKSNLDIMSKAIEFVKSFEIYGISSELDERLSIDDSKNDSQRRLEAMKKDCDKILDNINIYNEEDKVLSKEFPVRQYMQVMCEKLTEIEIERAKRELYKQLEQRVKSDKQGTSEEMQKINKIRLRNLKAQAKLLIQKTDWTVDELAQILDGTIDIEKIELYKKITERLENEQMEGVTEGNSNEKLYCEFIILVLYQLTKLEFVKEGQYKGLIYNNIWMNLQNQLREYKNSEIDSGSYRNVTFESLQKLTTNLTRINARLSDPLQYEIAKYEMKYYIKSIIEAFKGTKVPEGDEKLKSNGYVAVHYDLGDLEIKTTTHYRDRVATYGSADYGSGRIDNKNEKKRELRTLSYTKYLLKPVQKEGCPTIKQARLNKKIEEKVMSPLSIIGRESNYTARKIDIWKKDILRVTPRYFSANYDEKEDGVRIEFFSDLQNVQKYYSETSVIPIRNEVKERIEKIRKHGILSDNPFVIKVSRSQYLNFVKNELKELKNKIEGELNSKETAKEDNVAGK